MSKQKTILFLDINPSPMLERGIMPAFQKLGFNCILPYTLELRGLKYPYCMTNNITNEQKYKIIYQTIKQYRNKIDYIFLNGANYFYNAVSDAAKDFKKYFIYWATEDPILTDLMLPITTSKADLVLSPAMECVEKYRDLGLNAHLMMFACNPDYHKIGKYNPKYDLDVILQASCYNHSTRLHGYETIVKPAVELYENENINFNVYGAFWDSGLGMSVLKNHKEIYKGWHPNEDIPAICASSKIILGIQCSDTSSQQQSMRAMEILGSNGFHLTQWVPSVDYWFEDGSHLVTSRSAEETAEKIKYYLNNESKRNKIAECGYEYVRNNHTYTHRIKESILPNLV